jgi:alkyldihydroxyacetonephosphate synthase
VGIAAGAAEAVPGLQCSDSAPDKISYSRDLWPRHHIAVRAGRIADHKPAAIAWPENTEQVSALVRWCANEGVSLVPFGAGSGVCGGVLPTDNTLVVDLKRMKRWRSLDPERGYLDVEAGALGILMEEELQRKGYTIGHFPSSILCSTVGGWVAARGAGQCSGLYGKIEDMVVDLECVDGRGEVATLKRRLGGPDITPLIIGSEGVLGVVTSAKLRLHAVAEHQSFGSLSFGSLEAGYDAIREIYQRGLRPAVCRLYDPFDSMMARRGLERAERASGKKATTKNKSTPGFGAVAARNLLKFPGAINAAIEALGARVFGGSTLVLIFEGERARAQGELAEALSIGSKAGARNLGEQPARHWLDHRYSVSYRQAPMFMMGAFVDTMEVAAPWSQLGALYDGVREALGHHVMVMAHLSHAYPDGCSIYFTFAGSAESDEAAEQRYDAAWRSAMSAAIEAGGTLSHHHGVGRSKAPRMGDELGLGVELVAAIKDALDPSSILNPGNLIPEHPPPRIALPEPPLTPRLNYSSLLVQVAGTSTLAEVDERLGVRGLSLGLSDAAVDKDTTSVDSWIGKGSPGAPDPWLDPVDHLVAGYTAELPSGAVLDIRPCPRRAVGPDLYSLFHGTEGRAGRVHAVHLRARGHTAEPLETPLDREPAMDTAEEAWVERVLGAAAQLT